MIPNLRWKREEELEEGGGSECVPEYLVHYEGFEVWSLGFRV
jgi:hypothetical protein